MDVYTPYLCGRVKAFCMKTPVYDLIIGNVEGARNADAPDPDWEADRCAVTTRRQAKTEGQTIPLKVAEEVDLAVINPEKLKELQEADPTLHRYRNKEEPVMMRGKEITIVTRKGILYRQCETQADEKPVLQVVVPGCLRRQIMQLAHDSILGAHLDMAIRCPGSKLFSTGLIWEVMWHVSAGHATYDSAPSARAEYQKFPFRRCH